MKTDTDIRCQHPTSAAPPRRTSEVCPAQCGHQHHPGPQTSPDQNSGQCALQMAAPRSTPSATRAPKAQQLSHEHTHWSHQPTAHPRTAQRGRVRGLLLHSTGKCPWSNGSPTQGANLSHPTAASEAQRPWPVTRRNRPLTLSLVFRVKLMSDTRSKETLQVKGAEDRSVRLRHRVPRPPTLAI